MNWEDCKKLPWDIVLVLGGGMCSRSLSLSHCQISSDDIPKCAMDMHSIY